MDQDGFQEHLAEPTGRGPVPSGAVVGTAGGAPCGDLVRLAIRLAAGRIDAVTFDAEGCGAAVASASACVKLVEGRSLLEAARVGADDIVRELGGLSPGKRHAAVLAADALHRALTNLCRAGAGPLLEPSRARTLVAMSGGVDSAVAAVLARDACEEVVAVTLELWSDPATDGTQSCCSPEAVVSARSLAHSMGLPHLTLDLRDQFRQAVVDDFLGEHERGRTPNPCVRCNGMVRFGEMLALAERLGAPTLVTGHYARIAEDRDGPLLGCARDAEKDQAYMLSALSPAELPRLRFPLGELTKPEVRRIARAAALPVADKKESQDLCFMAGTNRRAFMTKHSARRDEEGEILDTRGRVIGLHRGHRHYTVGQRRGLGVAAPKALYVLEKRPAENRVVAGTWDELAVSQVKLVPARLHRSAARVDRARLRYRSEPVRCRVLGGFEAGERQSLELELEEPVHGVAAGQTACLLEGDLVLGHGTIAGTRLS